MWMYKTDPWNGRLCARCVSPEARDFTTHNADPALRAPYRSTSFVPTFGERKRSGMTGFSIIGQIPGAAATRNRNRRRDPGNPRVATWAERCSLSIIATNSFRRRTSPSILGAPLPRLSRAHRPIACAISALPEMTVSDSGCKQTPTSWHAAGSRRCTAVAFVRCGALQGCGWKSARQRRPLRNGPPRVRHGIHVPAG